MLRECEKWFKNLICTIGALPVLLLGSPGQSAPDAYAQYALKEPVTLMDLGLFKAELLLEKSLDGFRQRTGTLVLTYVKYDADSNRILFNVSLPDAPISNIQCKQIVDEVRRAGAIRDGRPIEGLPHSIYANGFKHEGRSGTGAPDGYLAGLDRITEIRVIGETECSGPLLGTHIDTLRK